MTKFKSLNDIVFYFGVMLSTTIIPQSLKLKSLTALCSIFKRKTKIRIKKFVSKKSISG